MIKYIIFEGYEVECSFDGDSLSDGGQWFNEVPPELTPEEQDAWESRLLESEVWNNLYEEMECQE